MTKSTVAVLLGALLVSACDPGVAVEFLVRTAGDDSTVQHSTQIAQALAERHSMPIRPLNSTCDLASYERNVNSGPGPHVLLFCVDDKGENVSLMLSEFITTKWSRQGDSLFRELEDTLRTRYGNRVIRHCSGVCFGSRDPFAP